MNPKHACGWRQQWSCGGELILRHGNYLAKPTISAFDPLEMAMKNGDPLLVQGSLKEEHSVVENERLIRLSERDWCWLLKWMEAPFHPNKQLQAAMDRYKLARRDEAGTSFNW